MRSSAQVDFRRRVSPRELPEWMDGDCSYEEFRDCLRSLEQVNRWLLGYRPTLGWLEGLPIAPPDPLHIVDVGSGGGDLLRQIAAWARRRGVCVQLTGIDLNPYAARAAAEFTPTELGISWVTGDALLYRPEKPIDIVVSSLMAHHLEDHEMSCCCGGWNRLRRSVGSSMIWSARSGVTDCFGGWRSWRDGTCLCSMMGLCPSVELSRRRDWLTMLAAAGIPREVVTVDHWWPGRLCIGQWK